MEPAPPMTAPAHVLPDAGTLTFLFTDVEGSTALWEQHEVTMRAVTARHDAMLDALITRHGARGYASVGKATPSSRCSRGPIRRWPPHSPSLARYRLSPALVAHLAGLGGIPPWRVRAGRGPAGAGPAAPPPGALSLGLRSENSPRQRP
ncbi:MAG: hypothetical protein ACRDIE_18200 [Chloroflexota bacterium]